MEAGQKFFAECITGARLDNARVRENHEMQWWKSMRWDNLRVGGSARYEGKGQGKGNPWSGLWDNPPAINVSLCHPLAPSPIVRAIFTHPFKVEAGRFMGSRSKPAL